MDTAETAKRIEQLGWKHVGAIAPKVAADLYNLQIVASKIQTIKNNETRFIIISKKNPNNEVASSAAHKGEASKASIRFVTEHKRGSLATVLNVMSDCNLNLTKIQSLPIIETPWKYAFFADVTFEQYAHFEKAKALLGIMLEDLKVLGEYKNAKI